MSRYYDRDGLPMTLEQYATVPENYYRIGDEERGDVRVSTVWLGIDHNRSGSGAPIIFETMVFGGPLDEHCWRYTTEAEARAGHAEVCSAAFRTTEAKP